MIYGIGTDLVEIGRIAKVLERYGERFARRILCEAELRRFHAHRQPAAYLAKRFAAKEAFSKALGTGIRKPASWHDIRVVNLESGRPALEFSAELQLLLQMKRVQSAHLSLTDEKDMAAATVILECAA
jgi:holo-[acyl-carrier protein] synthase